MSTEETRSPAWRLFSGWYGPPVLWLVQLPISFWLVWQACGDHRNLRLYLSVGTVVAVALATIVLERARRRKSRDYPSLDHVGAERTEFVAWVGTFMSIQVILVCAAQLLAIFIINPCQ